MAAVAVVRKRGREVEAEKRAGEAAGADAGEKGEAMGEGSNGRRVGGGFEGGRGDKRGMGEMGWDRPGRMLR
jgi:hypothetical protein